MPTEPGQVTVLLLCEDNTHASAVRRFLQRLGYGRVEVTKSPAGKQAAEQFVRERFPEYVAAVRRKQAQGSRWALVAVVDADAHTVDQRRTQLLELAPRRPSDGIAILVPKWNIETWLFDLTGQATDEAKSHKYQGQRTTTKEVVAAAVSRWHACRQGQRTECVPSLADAAVELLRLPGVEQPKAPSPELA